MPWSDFDRLWQCSAVPNRAKGGNSGAEQWSCIDVAQGVRNRCQRLNRRDHILLVSAVVADTGNFLVSTVAKISAPALSAGAVVASMPADADTLPNFPRGNAGA